MSPKNRGQTRRFGTAILNYGAGSFIPQLIGFLLLPLYTRFLSPADYGIADLCTSIGAVFVVITKLGLPGAVARFYFDFTDKEELKEYVRTIAAFLLVESTVLGAAAMALTALVGPRLFNEIPFYPYFFLTYLNAPFTVLSDLQRRLLQAEEKARHTALLNVSSAGIAIVLNVLFVAGFGWGATGLLLSVLVTSAIFSCVAVVQLRDHFRGGLRMESIGPSLRYGVPLVPNHIGGWLLQMGSRVVLASVGSSVQLGIFAVACKFVQPLAILETAFCAAFGPIYYKLRKREEETGTKEGIRSLGEKSIVAFICLFVLISCVMPGLLRFVTPPMYHGGGSLIWIVAAGVLASAYYHVVALEMFFLKRTSLVLPITMGGGVVAIAATAILVPRFGSAGAAAGSTLGQIATAVIGYWLNTRFYRLGLPYRWLLFWTACGLALGAGMSGPLPRNPLLASGMGAVAASVFSLVILYSRGLRWNSVKALLRGSAAAPDIEGRSPAGPIWM